MKKVYQVKIYFTETNGYTKKYVDTNDRELVNSYLKEVYGSRKFIIKQISKAHDYAELAPQILPTEITKDEITNRYIHFLTVESLLTHIEKYDIPSTAKVLIQRIPDYYFNENDWGAYYKKGEQYHNGIEWNETVDAPDGGSNKEEYPNFPVESLIKYDEHQLKHMMEQYHPAWSTVHYADDTDILFIDMHY